jgi:hypothetical protein
VNLGGDEEEGEDRDEGVVVGEREACCGGPARSGEGVALQHGRSRNLRGGEERRGTIPIGPVRRRRWWWLISRGRSGERRRAGGNWGEVGTGEREVWIGDASRNTACLRCGTGRKEGGVAVAPLITYQTFRTRQMTETPLGP